MKKKYLFFIMIFILPLSSFSKDDRFIHIDFFGIFTGAAKAYGQVALNSAKLAIKEINKVGILGRKFKLPIRDTKSDPSVALSVAKDLISENVDIFVGFHTSDERLSVKDYIESQNKLYLYTAIYEGRDHGKWTFFSGPIPNQIYGQSIPFISKKYGLKRVYLVGSDY